MQCNLQYEAAVRTHETHKLRVPQAWTHLDWQRPGVAQQNTPLVVVVSGNGTKVAHGMRLVGEFNRATGRAGQEGRGGVLVYGRRRVHLNLGSAHDLIQCFKARRYQRGSARAEVELTHGRHRVGMSWCSDRCLMRGCWDLP